MLGVRFTSIIPHKAVLTEANIKDQSGKVFIVTGGTGGIGKELVKILYGQNAKVYIAGRSCSKTKALIEELEETFPKSRGVAVFLKLELDDLTTIKASAAEFLAHENRLDVLWNNAGVMIPPKGSKTKQGYELQLGINNLGHFLFTQFLTPILEKTAKTSPQNSVRVIWVSSSAADGTPRPAIDFSNMDYAKDEGMWTPYMRSKAGSVIHSVEFARRTADSGIISIALNPGNFVTDLQANMPTIQLALFRLLAHEPIKGAYTELFAGLSPAITQANNGGWVSPFGKIEAVRSDMLDKELGRKYWEWSEAQVKPYL